MALGRARRSAALVGRPSRIGRPSVLDHSDPYEASLKQWFCGAGASNLQTATAVVCGGANVPSYTTELTVNPPANSRLVAICRGGRNGHSAAYSWSFTASGGLGAMTVAWTGAEQPAPGNTFARQMAIAYIDVGASPPTNVSVTVDAFATADVGNYGVALICLTNYNTGSWLAQTPGEAYVGTGSTSIAPALAGASTGQTIAVAFAEDNFAATVWNDPEDGWTPVAHTVTTDYYLGSIRQDLTGDASGSTIIGFAPRDNNTASAVIFEIAPAGGGPVAGSTTGPIPVVARITGAKVATTAAARAPVPAVVRPTLAKIASTASTRATVPVVARPALAKIASSAAVRGPVAAVARATGTKIAVGAGQAQAALVATVTGAGVTSAVQGAARFLATVSAQVSGAKVAGGSARGTIPTVSRATGSKIGTGATRATVAPVGRFTTTKVATSSALAALAMAARASATKLAGGATRGAVPATGQAAGSKSTATGAARAAVPIVARPTVAKIASGAVVSTSTVLGRIIGQVPGGLSVRAGVAVVARITGVKTTTAGAARVAVPVVARAAGTKSTAAGAVRAVVAPVVRATASKAATGAATVLAPAVARVTTTKLGRGSTVAPATATARASATKLSQGSMRGALAVIVRTPSRAPVEAWSWFIRRGPAWLQSSPKLDGVHPTSTDVT